MESHLSDHQFGFPQENLNRLLTSLPARHRRLLHGACNMVHLEAGLILATPERPLRHAYFPFDCVISLSSAAGACAPLGIGLIGREGMLGSTLMLGTGHLQLQATVQLGGRAARISRADLGRLAERAPAIREHLSRYAFHALDGALQNAACNHFHSIEARLARWLLMMQDRASGSSIGVTQHILAQLLGVQRVGITLAARALQLRGLISCCRGSITIENRPGLVAAACSCYGEAEQAYERLAG